MSESERARERERESMRACLYECVHIHTKYQLAMASKAHGISDTRVSSLQLPQCCPTPIRLLCAGESGAVNLSSLQIVSLLANAFLCTFPEDKGQVGNKFPRFNFCVLFEAIDKGYRNSNPLAQHMQKMLCILNYFDRQAQRTEAELARSLVTFHRRSHEHGRHWAHSRKRIADIKVDVLTRGTIEDADPTGCQVWEADFANSMIGGGVLGSGCVQEEIRFLLSPELIASRLITERMGDLENLVITGTERFSTYTGFASNFKFDGDYKDCASNDVVSVAGSSVHTVPAAEYRRKTTITAMDAIHFPSSRYVSQFRVETMRRELDKAYISFQHREDAGHTSDGAGVSAGARAEWVATGNWGCGAFGGDFILKAVIQIVAAAEAGRSLKYLTFGNDELKEQILELFGVLCDGDDGEGCTVGQVWQALEQFRLSRDQLAAPKGGQELMQYLLKFKWRTASPAAPVAASVQVLDSDDDLDSK